MSTCISKAGEFGSHVQGADYVCTRCGVLDEDGLIAELGRLREEREALRAENAGHRAAQVRLIEYLRVDGKPLELVERILAGATKARIDMRAAIDLRRKTSDALEALIAAVNRIAGDLAATPDLTAPGAITRQAFVRELSGAVRAAQGGPSEAPESTPRITAVRDRHGAEWVRADNGRSDLWRPLHIVSDQRLTMADLEQRGPLTDISFRPGTDSTPTDDPVNHPAHYTSHPSGVECIDITEHMGFSLGNAIKYIWRADLKTDDAIEDLQKAAWYLQREIARRTAAATTTTGDSNG